MDRESVLHAASILRDAGFVILRGDSLFSDAELNAAQAALVAEHARLRCGVVQRCLAARAPWRARFRQNETNSGRGRDDFCYKEAVSYTFGRLDHHGLLELPPFDDKPWRNRGDILQLCSVLNHGSACNMSTAGNLWAYPGARDTHWHRDGPDSMWGMFHVLTALVDLPRRAGHLHFQPFTHGGGRFFDSSDSHAAPDLHRGEPPGVPVVLRRGESVLFDYTTKHAATPNPIDLNIERNLFYAVYGPAGRADTVNHGYCPTSLFEIPATCSNTVLFAHEEEARSCGAGRRQASRSPKGSRAQPAHANDRKLIAI